ncbi:MAG: transcription elongation factor Spt5 [Thermoproteus sp.]|jgi:transcriptional antiterminator NusG|nr:MAG: antitermination protein NusG [Thermoproteus sp. JCHS_4]MCI4464764.1 transcription elongation factor Spt5 [Thermoproteus sp.]MDT7868951.1 transcription elongation factor Spt5 [Thermoproteus sp.]MDT7881628.1 transcription elongation factor Spt5 [Thermoproteus sp.]
MASQQCPVYSVSVVGRQEYNVTMVLKLRSESGKQPVYSILVPKEPFGVIFMEAESLAVVYRVVSGVKHVKGVLKGKTSLEEIVKYIEPKKPAIDIDVNDEVEILADVLKGSRGRVVSVDREKGLVRVELLDSPFPMPLDLKATEVKVTKKAGR